MQASWENAIENIMNKKIFGQSGEKIIIEEFKNGKEFQKVKNDVEIIIDNFQFIMYISTLFEQH